MDKVLGVFGVGLGTFELALEKYDYRAGENVRGLFRFRLKRPQKARRVVLEIKAWQQVTTRTKDEQGRSHQKRHTETLYHYDQVLDGEREYNDGEYFFELRIPPEVLLNAPGLPEGIVGDIGRAAAYLMPIPRRGSIAWEVSARLEIPWKVSPSKKTKITVSAPEPPGVPEPGGFAAWPGAPGPPPNYGAGPPPPQPLPPPRRRVYQCTFCDEVFVDETTLRRHEEGHRTPAPGYPPAPPHVLNPAPRPTPAQPPAGSAPVAGTPCSACGDTEHSAKAKFCGNCGNRL